MLKSSLSIILIFVLLSCSKTREKNISPEDLKVIEISQHPNKNLNVSIIYDTIKLVQLESSEKESLVGIIDKLIAFKEKYYIKDKTSNSILIFDFSGKFISKVNRHGRGPKEYEEITDFIINRYNHTIEIFDRVTKKILTFDLVGNFISDRTVNFDFTSFCASGNNSYIFFNGIQTFNEKYAFDIMNVHTNGEIIFRAIPFKPGAGRSLIFNNETIKPVEDNLYINFILRDTIYKFQNNNLRPFFFVNFGNNVLPKKPDDIYELLKLSENHFFGHKILAESSKYIILRFFYKKKWAYALYNKTSGKTQIYNELVNNINEIPLVFDQPSVATSYTSHIFYTCLYPHELGKMNIINSINDNPIIVTHSLK